MTARQACASVGCDAPAEGVPVLEVHAAGIARELYGPARLIYAAFAMCRSHAEAATVALFDSDADWASLERQFAGYRLPPPDRASLSLRWISIHSKAVGVEFDAHDYPRAV